MRDGAKKDLARSLRKHMTDAERAIWRHLRMGQLGVRFRRQHPIGPYVADFVCLECALIIEIDGGQHNDSASDRQRDAWLLAHGFRVKRYWNDEVLLRAQDVLADICSALAEARPHPSLPPQAGEGAEACADAGLAARAQETAKARPHPSLPPRAGEGAEAAAP